MNLVVLYGPPAVGKLTVASELAAQTGFTLFDNHKIIDVIKPIIPFDNPQHVLLEREVRRLVVEAAANSGVDLIITGAVHNGNKDTYQAMIDAYEKREGKVRIVQLIAGREVLDARVGNPSRKEKFNSAPELNGFIHEHPESLGKFFEGEQLVIDTSKKTPLESAKQIVSYYHLL